MNRPPLMRSLRMSAIVLLALMVATQAVPAEQNAPTKGKKPRALPFLLCSSNIDIASTLPGGARSHMTLFDHHHALDACRGQVEGGAEAVDARADHDNIC